MNANKNSIDEKLKQYKRRFYKKLLFKGLALFLSFAIGGFLLFTTLEYSFYLGSLARAILFFGYLGLFMFLLYYLIIKPLLYINVGAWQISDDEAAKHIGTLYPEVGDRLLNMIQLRKTYADNSLAQASISQRTVTLGKYDFNRAISYSDLKKYWQIALLILFLLTAIWMLNPAAIIDSSRRIVNYEQSFTPAAPFTFHLADNQLVAFKNEDFTVNLSLEGQAIPNQVYIETSSRRIKMNSSDANSFSYTFSKIQENVSFQFEGAGYTSGNYNITVVNRPQIGDFNVIFEYPGYLNRNNDRLENTGNLQVPEGTKVTWQMQPRNAEDISFLYFADKDTLKATPDNSRLASFTKTLKESSDYEIRLKNQFSENKEKILYTAEVIKDQYPSMNLNIYQDTVLYSFIMMSGNLNDDYGLTRLKLFYREKSQSSKEFSSIDIPIARSQNSQSFNYNWVLDSTSLVKGQFLEYYLQLWDNDGVNGHKSSKSGIYTFKVPGKREIKDKIDNTTQQTEEHIDNTLQEARELNKTLEEVTERMKGKKEMNWQDQQKLDELFKKREELNKALEELKKKYDEQEMQRDRFNPQNEKIKEKVEQLQKLMDELLDEETKKLYEELKKLLEEQMNMNNLQEHLNQMQHKEKNMEKELERTLELFKKMKFDHKLNEVVQELEEMSQKQEELAEKSQKESNNKSWEEQENKSLMEEQQELQKDFEEVKESLKEAEDMNQELKQPEMLPEDLEQQKESIEQKMQDSQQKLQQNKKKQSSESQKKAAEEMKEMKEQLSQMQSNMEMEMMMENLNDLRHIVHNLLKLSFDQEKLMKEFGQVQQSDPRFVALSQQQLKIKDDSQIIEDSLQSLANRVFQIRSFVTRELSNMNFHLDKTADAIKERKKSIAVSEQQFTMTSMNNLALLLDDVLQQMQNAMAEAMGNPKPGNNKSQKPSLGQMQQELNNKIEELKKSGKSGRPLSEELAKLAAEQERIRKALQEMQEKFGQEDGKGQKPGQGVPEKMEETELDLVNKQITEETIRRQRQILTRLLEAEKALRERELDEERKGETANPVDRELPPSFEEYFKQKQQEIELLKTIPPKLFPYYRKEVNEYFKRLGEQAN